MAAPTTTALTTTKPFRAGEKVIAVSDIGPLPEGTAGVVKMAVGLTWPRYWVAWEGDFGKWSGSVSENLLVRAKEWEDFKRRREEERNRPPEPSKAEATDEGPQEGATEEGASANAASKVPAHLLERSKAARAKRASGG
jgi:hypothetical protein